MPHRRVYRHAYRCARFDCDTRGLIFDTGIDHHAGCGHPNAEPIAARVGKRRTPGFHVHPDGSMTYVPYTDSPRSGILDLLTYGTIEDLITVSSSHDDLTVSSSNAATWTLGTVTVHDEPSPRIWPAVLIGALAALIIAVVLITAGVGR